MQGFVLQRPSQAWTTVIQDPNRVQGKLFIRAGTVVDNKRLDHVVTEESRLDPFSYRVR